MEGGSPFKTSSSLDTQNNVPVLNNPFRSLSYVDCLSKEEVIHYVSISLLCPTSERRRGKRYGYYPNNSQFMSEALRSLSLPSPSPIQRSASHLLLIKPSLCNHSTWHLHSDGRFPSKVTQLLSFMAYQFRFRLLRWQFSEQAPGRGEDSFIFISNDTMTQKK